MNIDSINNSGEICNNDVACMANFNKMRSKYEKAGYYNTSLTHLNGLSGVTPVDTDQGSIYGAEFKTVHSKPAYYEYLTSELVEAPWLGQPVETTFMNQLKVLNEEPVQTYKDLQLSSIPQDRNEVYKPIIYLEGFGKNDTQNYFFKLLMVFVVILIIFLLLRKMN